MSSIAQIPFAVFFRTNHAIMLYIDGETGRLLDANNAALAFYGYTLPQIQSMKISDITKLPPQELDAEKNHTYFIVPHQLANGEIRTVEVHTTPIETEGRKRLFSIIHDISASRKAEEEVEQKDFFLRKAQELGKIGHFNFNPETSIVEGSPELFRIFDVAPGEPLFEGFANAVHPDDRHLILPCIDRAVKEGIPYDVEHRVRHRDGTVLHVRAKGEILATRIGRRMVGTVQDITDSIRTEKAREETEERYRSLFTEMHEGFALHEIICNDSGVPVDYRFLDMNPAFEKLTGLDKTSVIGKTVLQILPKTESIWIERYGRVALTGKPDRFENYSRELNRHYEVVAFSPKHGFFAVLFSDITERKRTEETLQNTQKLDSLGILAGGIAHDFNNLLGGVFGYIDMANETSTEPKVSNFLAKALSAIDRARGLTRQLLTFAKGGAPIRQIGPLFPFVQETAQFALSGSSVACSFGVPDNLWNCNFDKNQVGQVIDNIVINAQQAMPSGGVIELTARNVSITENERPPLIKGAYVRITIKDTGIGIPADILPRIFDPFFTTKAKGHGLGLATCFSIVNRHGGCIEVESVQGKGSTFHVFLPAASETSGPCTEETAVEHRGNGTFLVMDDEIVVRESLGSMLESFGYTVAQTESGEEALAFCAQEKKAGRAIAGMIFDLTIPGGMGGEQTVREIRRSDNRVPVFVVSGYADDPVMANPSKYGFTASICKPFRKGELSKVLARYMKTTGEK